MDESEAVKIPVQIDVSAISTGLKQVASQIAAVKASLASLVKTPAIGQLTASLNAATGSANRLANALSAVSKSYGEIPQAQSKTSGSGSGAVNPIRAGMSDALSGSQAELKKLREITGSNRSLGQAHSEQLKRVSEHALAVQKMDTSRDLAQASSDGTDIWQKRASDAEAKYGKDIAAGVDPNIAAEARDKRLAQIRAERDRAHAHKLASDSSRTDENERAQFGAGIISPAEYQKYLSNRIGQLDPSSTKFAELTERLKKLEAKAGPNQQVQQAIGRDAEDPVQRQRDKADAQAKRWSAEGADPAAVATWRTQQMAQIDSREQTASTKSKDEQEKSEYQGNAISLTQYKQYLQQRLAAYAEYSAQWNKINKELQGLDEKADAQQLQTLKAGFADRQISSKDYQTGLQAVIDSAPSGSQVSNEAETALGREDRKISSADSAPKWMDNVGRSFEDGLGRTLEETILRGSRSYRSRKKPMSELKAIGADALASGEGSIVRSGATGLSRSIFSGIGDIFGGRREAPGASATGAPWSERFSGQSGGLSSLPQMLTQIKGGFSGLLGTLTKGFGQAAAGLQSILALSGAEGKKRQRHSLFGGILGGVAGSVVGNWYGGFNLGSAIGGMFAEGGYPPVGVPSIVGEHGPELFVPSRQGRIVSNSDLRSMGSTRGGGSQNVVVTVNHYGDVHGGDDVQRMYSDIPMAVVNALPVAKGGV